MQKNIPNILLGTNFKSIWMGRKHMACALWYFATCYLIYNNTTYKIKFSMLFGSIFEIGVIWFFTTTTRYNRHVNYKFHSIRFDRHIDINTWRDTHLGGGVSAHAGICTHYESYIKTKFWNVKKFWNKILIVHLHILCSHISFWEKRTFYMPCVKKTK